MPGAMPGFAIGRASKETTLPSTVKKRPNFYKKIFMKTIEWASGLFEREGNIYKRPNENRFSLNLKTKILLIGFIRL